MTDKSNDIKDAEHSARRDVARGAGSVLLAKTGSAIDIVTQPAYTWMFGLATYGLYSVLWSLVNLIENIADLAMTDALQRVLPAEREDTGRAAIIKAAFVLGVLPCLVIAALVSIAAPLFAPLFNVAGKDLPQLVLAIRLFAWAIPVWAILEIATSALRACQAFGPEIRLRLFWEQIVRVILATLLWLAGMEIMALLLAHLCSLGITAVLALRVLNHHCNLRRILSAKTRWPIVRELFLSGLSILPGNALARVFTDVPTILLNFTLPGAAGANAAGLYSIARKLSSIPQLVRSVFGHVVSPVAAAKENRNHHALQALYTFSIRLSVLLALPTAMALIMAADSVLALFVTGAAAAWPIVFVLTLARGMEASLGPAGALLQVVGHRGLPVLNSVAGLIIAIVVFMFTYPQYAATGLALAVAVGRTGIAVLPVVQLSRLEKLRPFDGSFRRILLGALVACFIILLVGRLSVSFPPYINGPLILLSYLAVLWLSVRLALPKKDRLALGKLGRRLRFVTGAG